MRDESLGPTNKSLLLVSVCVNQRPITDRLPSCANRGSHELFEELEKMLQQQGIRVKIVKTACMNKCRQGPNIRVQKGRLFNCVRADSLHEIVDAVNTALQLRKSPTPSKIQGLTN